jgi:hypothetical protein
VFARFRALVLADPELQGRLRAETDWDRFVAVARGLGLARGCPVTADELLDARRAVRRALIERTVRGDSSELYDDLAATGWTPIHIATVGAQPAVEWCDLRGLAFDEPFFEDTVQRALREPYRLLFRPRTTIDALAGAAHDGDRVQLAGFVFHASSSGSTLVCRMLGALPGTLVLSEPPPLDHVLRAPGVDPEKRGRWLRWALDALAQRRGADDRHVVVTFDAWSACELPLVRAVFPEVPWLFLYRAPEEVIASQLRQRGRHMVPGLLPPELFGLRRATVLDMPPEDYCARVVAAILDAGLGGLDAAARLISSPQLPGAVEGEVLEHFGLTCDEDGRRRMHDATAADAKTPMLPFDPVVVSRGRPVTEAIRRAADRWAASSFARLEELRAAQAVGGRPPR